MRVRRTAVIAAATAMVVALTSVAALSSPEYRIVKTTSPAVTSAGQTVSSVRYDRVRESTTTTSPTTSPTPSPTPAPSPTPSPTPVAQQGRLGLHVTSAELAQWRQRATSGPFRTAGDAWTNSFGDWDRLTANARSFAADPAASRWNGPTDNNPGGCVTGNTTGVGEPPASARAMLRDAAFVSLVNDDAALRRTAADALLAQARVADLDFADRTRWCGQRRINDLNPGFEIAGFLTSMVYAYDYLTIADPSVFTDAERRLLLDWFARGALWMVEDVDLALAPNFTDRLTRSGPPYTLSSWRLGSPDVWSEPYAGAGARIGALAKYYNNRRAGLMRYVGVVAVLLADEGHQVPANPLGYTRDVLRDRAHRFVREYLVYSVYADGFVGEFERVRSDFADLGWAYATQTLAPLLTIADTFARSGDPSLYTFSTTAGVHGTEGAPAGQSGKSLLSTTRALLSYVDGSTERYAPGRAGDSAHRIDGYEPARGWDSVHDLQLVPANRWFRDAWVDQVTSRRAPGTRAFPARPASIGMYQPSGGDWGTLPAVLFMFGGPASASSPYGG
jgi:hypothetical protein